MWHGACEDLNAKANFNFPNFFYELEQFKCSTDDIILRP